MAATAESNEVAVEATPEPESAAEPEASSAPEVTAPGSATAEGEFTIDQCRSCESQISLRSPTPDSPASAWLCNQCGAVFFARSQQKDGVADAAGTRLAAYTDVMKKINAHLESRASSISAKDVQRLVQCLAARTFSGREGRKQKRFPVAAPVTVVPLGADLRVVGPAARVMTINVSGGGAALVHVSRIVEPYLAIDFAASGVDLLPVVLRVTRVRPLAAAYEVAGMFLSRILH